MLTIPNILSLIRLPLAILFIPMNPVARTAVLLTAAATDFLDGYIARNWGTKTRLGTILDPITDKLFVVVALSILIIENRITWIETLAMLGRDFAVLLFGSYLILKGRFGNYQFRSIWCGKITTAFQFVVLILLVQDITIPLYYYALFALLGFAALGELYISCKSIIPPELKKSKAIKQNF